MTVSPGRRDTLQRYNCDLSLKEVFPKKRDERDGAFSVYRQTASLPSNYIMYSRPAVKLASIPEACRMYTQMGCAFVMNLQITSKSKTDWTAYLNGTTSNIRNNYIDPLNTVVKDATYYIGANASI